MECEVWSEECEVWSVKCEVWSVKCGVWSVDDTDSKSPMLQYSGMARSSPSQVEYGRMELNKKRGLIIESGFGVKAGDTVGELLPFQFTGREEKSEFSVAGIVSSIIPR